MSCPLPALPPNPAILFVTATRIGDAVLSTSLLRAMLAAYPGARYTVAAGPVAAPLFAAMPGLEQLIPVKKRRYAGHWFSLYRTVAGRRWDLVVDLRGSALAYLLRARHRRVMAKGDPSEHRVRQLARLFALDPPPSPLLWAAPADEAAARRLIAPGGPVLGVGPTANWRGKQWRAARFAELTTRLTAVGGPFAGARVAVFAAPHERDLAARVLAAVPPDRLIDLTEVQSLSTVTALLEQVTLFIGNDTGLMHMAAAVGTPTLGLFGPSPAIQYAPYGPHTAVAQTKESYAALVGAPDFNHKTTDSLMDGLTVDMAERAALRLWHQVVEARQPNGSSGGRS